MKTYKLSDFNEFLTSKDPENRKLGWTMVKSSFNPKKMNLEELCRLQLDVCDQTLFSKEANNFFSLVTKALFNKYSKRAILGMYEKN